MSTHADGRTGAAATSTPVGERYVYDLSEGNADMRALLGGKGAGVAEMMRIGVPVPDGFTVTTSACVAAMRNGGAWPERLWDEIQTHLDALERRTGRTLGAAERPLLVSVRSGAVLSMPGMMDTILNLGISDESAEGLAAESGDPRFAWDSYRRFVQMYGEVVEGVPGQAFEDELTTLKERRGVTLDTALTTDDLKELVATFRGVARQSTGHDLPTDPHEQLRRSVDAVFGS
ncbi:PEP/pyruvate-binding domain-containing protein, partial [Streptomyces griseoincarnatus]